MQEFLEKTLEQLEDIQLAFEEIDREGVIEDDLTPIFELLDSLREEVTSLNQEEY